MPFEFGDEEDASMEKLKPAIVASPALRLLDYVTDQAIILAVDSSPVTAGYILSQIGDDDKRYLNWFGSITFNDRKSRYSQAKLELYGLFRSLKVMRVHIIGAKNLLVEVDAKYIKGMINKPDIQPNAAINRWIAAILLFDFRLMHIPGDRYSGPDGLSHWPHTNDGDNENSDDVEDWIDLAGGFTIAMENPFPCRSSPAIAPGPIAGDRRDPLIFFTSFSSRDVSSFDIASAFADVEQPPIPRSDKAL
jgi:RNase H-like domain found in reverse transcriptase